MTPFLNENQVFQLTRQQSASDETIIQQAQFYNRFPPEMASQMFLNIPSVYQEFEKHYQSTDLDNEYNHKLLLASFHASRKRKLDNLVILDTDEQEPLDFLKRYGYDSPQLKLFLNQNPPPGTPIPSFHQFQQTVYRNNHSFKNIAPPMPLTIRSHQQKIVSIGFCDLWDLLEVDLAPNEEEHKIEYFGFEANPFNVAKYLVVLEMLKKVSVPLDSVLQVWYSSGWSRETEDTFRKTCKDLLSLNSLDSRELQGSNVRKQLSAWSSAQSIPLSTSRVGWRCLHPSVCNVTRTVYNLKRVQDRMDYIKYVLTGEIDEHSEVGSLSMFSRETIPEESFFHSICTDRILREQTDSLRETTILQECRIYVLEKLSELRKRISNGTFSISLEYGIVAPDNDLLVRISQDIQPQLILWSNVPDYFAPEVFHEMARKMTPSRNTAHYTEHVFCTMNYLQRIYGIDPYEIFPISSRNVQFENVKARLQKQVNILACKIMEQNVSAEHVRNLFHFDGAAKHYNSW
eukprot:CAMPEP_0117435756 /NCGR_PEP_ID=MMETSP0759-20121206/647_1 /TAXON_ID=63605 /ORGANISM="Percolomonas cosmopolitus, Strain WS" /LENGTH=515 /DNA_ID=CAMNT_0005227317 /DNA_START=127 /DNA_END=1671 /DNA_ORIENTATION=+